MKFESEVKEDEFFLHLKKLREELWFMRSIIINCFIPNCRIFCRTTWFIPSTSTLSRPFFLSSPPHFSPMKKILPKIIWTHSSFSAIHFSTLCPYLLPIPLIFLLLSTESVIVYKTDMPTFHYKSKTSANLLFQNWLRIRKNIRRTSLKRFVLSLL